MSTVLSTPPQTFAPASPSRWLLIVFAVIVVVWVGLLSWLTLNTANPPVVNRVQILSSDLVLVGRWQDVAAGNFDVTRELKYGELTGVVTLLGPKPATATPNEAEWVIPVRRTKNALSITEGKFINRPQQNDIVPPGPEWRVAITPQIYPATASVFEQIDRILAAASPVKSPR